MEQTLGKRIAENRKKLKLTQDQLAEQLGVTAQAVSKWENDQSCPDITILPRLADIFGISTDALLGRESAPPVFEGEVIEEDEKGKDGIYVNNGKWEFQWDSGRRDALSLAIWVLAVGGLALAGQFLNWDASFWDILWPSFLVVFGLSGLFSHFSVFRIGMVLVGSYYLVHNLDIWTLDIAGNLVWPALIVLFGLGLLIDAFKKPKKNRFHINRRGGNSAKTQCNHSEEGEEFESSLSFGENCHTIELDRLSHGSVNVSFGELVIDLTECEEIADGCTIDAKCSFGELVLEVPTHCKVITNTGTSLAEVNYQGHHDSDADTTIYVNGHISFGELCIRYK